MKDLLLVIDVGNTHVVFGVYREKELINHWRLASSKGRTSDEFGLLFEQIFRYHKLEMDKVKAIIISSVVPNLLYTLDNMANRYFCLEPLVVGPGIKTGIDIKYDNPKEVGADRIVNAVAGYEKYGGPLILVDFGTAITFDLISKKGDYLGGVIAPGIKIASDALFAKTAKLPKVEIVKPDRVIGRNTINSIQSGLVHGYVGMVDYLLEKICQELKEDINKVNIIATGGFSSMIFEDSKYIRKLDGLLTLEGLRIIYERNE